MKLYGKELEEELQKRHDAKAKRREQRISIHNYAHDNNIDALELLAWERGEDVCPHEEYVQDFAAFHPIMFEKCKVCGKVKEESVIGVKHFGEEIEQK